MELNSLSLTVLKFLCFPNKLFVGERRRFVCNRLKLCAIRYSATEMGEPLMDWLKRCYSTVFSATFMPFKVYDTDIQTNHFNHRFSIPTTTLILRMPTKCIACEINGFPFEIDVLTYNHIPYDRMIVITYPCHKVSYSM